MSDKPSKDEIEIEEEVVEEKPGVEVDIEKKQEPQYVTKADLEKERKRQEYLNRQNEKRHKELLDALNGIKQKEEVEQETEPVDLDELDQLAQKDWKAAVDKLGEKAARRVLEERYKEEERQRKQKEQVEILNQSRAKVSSKYNLEDENSIEYKLYTEAMNENPQFLSNPYGPELTMYKMEEKLRQRGIKLPEERQEFNQEVDLEAQRRERIGVGGAIPGSSGGSGKVTLTSDQVQFAKDANIPLEVMAKMVKKSASNYQEGVSVDDE